MAAITAHNPLGVARRTDCAMRTRFHKVSDGYHPITTAHAIPGFNFQYLPDKIGPCPNENDTHLFSWLLNYTDYQDHIAELVEFFLI